MFTDRPEFSSFDLETTGLLPGVDQAIQVGIQRYRGEQQGKYGNWLLRPTVPISDEASQIHGHTLASLAGQPVFAEVGLEIAQYMHLGWRPLLVGYNSDGLDVPILRRQLSEIGIAWAAESLDVYMFVSWFFRQFGKGQRKLEAMAARCSVALPKAHDAVDDARAAAGVMFWMQSVGMIPTTYAMAKRQELEYATIKKAEEEAFRWYFYIRPDDPQDPDSLQLRVGFSREHCGKLATEVRPDFWKWMLEKIAAKQQDEEPPPQAVLLLMGELALGQRPDLRGHAVWKMVRTLVESRRRTATVGPVALWQGSKIIGYAAPVPVAETEFSIRAGTAALPANDIEAQRSKLSIDSHELPTAGTFQALTYSCFLHPDDKRIEEDVIKGSPLAATLLWLYKEALPMVGGDVYTISRNMDGLGRIIIYLPSDPSLDLQELQARADKLWRSANDVLPKLETGEWAALVLERGPVCEQVMTIQVALHQGDRRIHGGGPGRYWINWFPSRCTCNQTGSCAWCKDWWKVPPVSWDKEIASMAPDGMIPVQPRAATDVARRRAKRTAQSEPQWDQFAQEVEHQSPKVRCQECREITYVAWREGYCLQHTRSTNPLRFEGID